MTKENFYKITSEAWDACVEASNEGIGYSDICVEYDENYTEKELWNDTISDFIDAYLAHIDEEDYDFEYARMTDILDDLWK